MPLINGVAGKPRSGKGGRITWGTGNKILNLQEWTINDHGDDLDTTSFEDMGLDTGLIGIEGVEFTFRGNWDASANFYDSPPGIFPNSTTQNVILYENVTDNVFWVFPWVRVISVQQTNAVRGTVTFSASCKSQGPFTRPTGSV